MGRGYTKVEDLLTENPWSRPRETGKRKKKTPGNSDQQSPDHQELNRVRSICIASVAAYTHHHICGCIVCSGEDVSQSSADNKKAGGHGRGRKGGGGWPGENSVGTKRDRRDWPRRSICRKESVMTDERKTKNDEARDTKREIERDGEILFLRRYLCGVSRRKKAGEAVSTARARWASADKLVIIIFYRHGALTLSLYCVRSTVSLSLFLALSSLVFFFPSLFFCSSFFSFLFFFYSRPSQHTPVCIRN